MKDPERFVTFVLGTFMFVFYGGLGLQTARIWRRIGRCPVPAFAGGSAREKLEAAAGVSWPFLVLAWAHCPRCFRAVPRFEALEGWPARLLGLLCLCLAASVVWVAYAELGDSWRIGIDPRAGPLVRTGIYASVRHPVYAGFSVALLGIFLLAPNLMFAILWSAGTGAVAWQAAREEKFLNGRLGGDYRGYCGRTGRFLPPLLR